jgi:hypothetical protein
MGAKITHQFSFDRALATHYTLGITKAFRLCYTFLNDFSFPGSSIFTKALRSL